MSPEQPSLFPDEQGLRRTDGATVPKSLSPESSHSCSMRLRGDEAKWQATCTCPSYADRKTCPETWLAALFYGTLRRAGYAIDPAAAIEVRIG